MWHVKFFSKKSLPEEFAAAHILLFSVKSSVN